MNRSIDFAQKTDHRIILIRKKINPKIVIKFYRGFLCHFLIYETKVQ